MTITQERGNVPWVDMVNTFNLGVGFIVVLPESASEKLVDASGGTAFKIGTIAKDSGSTVQFDGNWGSY